MTGKGDCIDLQNKNFITVSGLNTRYCQRNVDMQGSSGIILENFTYNYSAGYNGINMPQATNYIVRNGKLLGHGIVDADKYDAVGGDELTSAIGLFENIEASNFGHAGINPKHDKVVFKSIYAHDFAGNPFNQNHQDDNAFVDIRARGCVGVPTLNSNGEGDAACFKLAGNRNIVLFAEVWTLDGPAIFIGRPESTKNDNFIGHSTFAHINMGSSNGVVWINKNAADPAFNDLGFFNNLFAFNSNNNEGTPTCHMIKYIGDGSPTPANTNSRIRGNGFYSDGCTDYFFVKGSGALSVAAFESAFSSQASGNVQLTDPLFAGYLFDNPNFGLSAGSPAIDAGVFLTTTANSGTGTQVKIDYEDWVFGINAFITNGLIDNLAFHTITIGDDTDLKVVARNGKTITVDREITWSSGQNVSFDYAGNAPDIGVREGVTAAELPTAQND